MPRKSLLAVDAQPSVDPSKSAAMLSPFPCGSLRGESGAGAAAFRSHPRIEYCEMGGSVMGRSATNFSTATERNR